MRPKLHFVGWTPIGENDVIKQGDRFVDLRDNVSPINTRNLACNSVGYKLKEYVEVMNDGDLETCPFWVYRKTGGPSIPRRIIGHKAFSQPLPLP